MSVLSPKQNKPSATNPARKKFQCGWCKFKAVFSATILRHHERKHPGLELDIIIVKQPGRPLTSPVKDEEDALSSTEDIRCHGDALCDDLVLPRLTHTSAACEETTSSDQKPCRKKEKGVSTLSDKLRRGNYKMQTAQIKCKDILKGGAMHIQELTDKYSLSKVCFDALQPQDFYSFATKFKHQLMYVDSNKPDKEPRDLQNLPNDEIIKLVSGKK